ncbi:MAG: hypothetical protein IJ588_01120 [Prevotella sp.]|nr:hypothetical protein [Prevotella sp.]
MAKYIIKTNASKSDGKVCYFYSYCGKLCQTPIGVCDISAARKFSFLGDACIHLHHIEHQEEKAFGWQFEIVRVSKGKDGLWHERETVNLADEKYRL